MLMLLQNIFQSIPLALVRVIVSHQDIKDSGGIIYSKDVDPLITSCIVSEVQSLPFLTRTASSPLIPSPLLPLHLSIFLLFHFIP